MVTEIETDYLVIGAGAAGMAFTDALIAEYDVDVVMVDRRNSPGGHWNDAYPFVRLHQPSAFYGVNSRPLGHDTIDTTGPNAGFYERATGVEICDYFRHVLEDHLLPSGQVRFFGMCDYVGDWSSEHAFTSRLSGKTTTVRVRRKVVDTTYLENSVPATHTPSFEIDAEARVVPVGELVTVVDPPAGYTVLGAGKTAMDACSWLLDNGVDPDKIRWVKPRESWVIDRAALQPLDLLPGTVELFSLGIEAMAQAENVEDLFERLEAGGQLARLDSTVAPTMFRGAILNQAERDGLRQIERVVRQGRVLQVGADRIALEDGTIPTERRAVHVDCTAYGLRAAPTRPIFEPGRITLQAAGQTTPAAAQAAFVESAWDDDADKNRLCPPTPTPSQATDWISFMSFVVDSFTAAMADPRLTDWLERSRLNLTRGLSGYMSDPRMQSAMTRFVENTEPALKNAEQLLADSASAS